MPTECSAEPFDFGRVEGRLVEAAFDAGLVTSDAGALLLGATDRAIDLVGRCADCFRDHRRPDLIEHAVGTLIGQRVLGIALGYEDLYDHARASGGALLPRLLRLLLLSAAIHCFRSWRAPVRAGFAPPDGTF